MKKSLNKFISFSTVGIVISFISSILIKNNFVLLIGAIALLIGVWFGGIAIKDYLEEKNEERDKNL